MKRLFRVLRWLPLLPLAATLYVFSIPDTSFRLSEKMFELSKPISSESVARELKEQGIIRFPLLFQLFYGMYGEWELVQPGKYTARKGQTLFQTAQQLKNSRKSIVRLVINRLRLKEDFAHLIDKQFIIDSTSVMQFIQSNDSLK
jgi:UPF0755 protein